MSNLRSSLIGVGPRALVAAVLLGACAPPDAELIEQRQSAYTSVAPNVRPSIHDFGPTAREDLANAILAFITQPILDEHANGHDWHQSTELFFIRHHAYMNELEAYLLDHGMFAYLPVPKWDPATPIPDEFMVFDSLVAPQDPMNQTPDMHVEDAVNVDDLCSYRTATDLAAAVNGWHGSVHIAVGGAMGVVVTAPGAPIFWLWHGFLDDLYHTWQWKCGVFPALASVVL